MTKELTKINDDLSRDKVEKIYFTSNEGRDLWASLKMIDKDD